jgi:hypothetical protein
MNSGLAARLAASEGDPFGAQRPAVRVVPPAVSSAGPEVVDLAKQAGLVLDPWQCYALEDSLGERVDGSWAAFLVVVLVSRQCGKGTIVEARELGGLFLLGEKLILHTAHQVKTATEAFVRSKELFQRNPDLDREINRINNSHGEEGIELRNGARLRFIARSRVSGRGFSGDCVILDEAFELQDTAVDSLVPTMSARPNPQLWYTSSAVNQKHHHNGRVLARVRRRALSGGTDRLVYLDWGVDLADVEDMKPAEREALRRDPRAWRATNPGLGYRISEEHVLSELDALSADGFDVERLGIGDWPVDDADGWAVVSREAWDALVDLDAPRPSPVAFAADVTPGRTHTTVAAAGRGPGGLMHVEVIDHRPGTAWVADRAAELVRRYNPVAFALDPAHEAGSLIAPLGAAGVEVVAMTMRDTAQAHGQFMELATDSKTLRHRDDGDLNEAVKGATQRDLSGAKAWDRLDSSVVLSPLVAVTAAVWAYVKHAPVSADPGVWVF